MIFSSRTLTHHNFDLYGLESTEGTIRVQTIRRRRVSYKFIARRITVCFICFYRQILKMRSLAFAVRCPTGTDTITTLMWFIFSVVEEKMNKHLIKHTTQTDEIFVNEFNEQGIVRSYMIPFAWSGRPSRVLFFHTERRIFHNRKVNSFICSICGFVLVCFRTCTWSTTSWMRYRSRCVSEWYQSRWSPAQAEHVALANDNSRRRYDNSIR